MPPRSLPISNQSSLMWTWCEVKLTDLIIKVLLFSFLKPNRVRVVHLFIHLFIYSWLWFCSWLFSLKNPKRTNIYPSKYTCRLYILCSGSTFSKVKPLHGVLAVARSGLLRVIFMPLYCDYWTKQTSKWICFAIMMLYLAQVGTMIVYLTDESGSLNNEVCKKKHALLSILQDGSVYKQ